MGSVSRCNRVQLPSLALFHTNTALELQPAVLVHDLLTSRLSLHGSVPDRLAEALSRISPERASCAAEHGISSLVTAGPESTAYGKWDLERPPKGASMAPTSARPFDPHSSATVYLDGAFWLEKCPKCEAKQYDSVALPVERLGTLLILVDDPDAGVGYQKQ